MVYFGKFNIICKIKLLRHQSRNCKSYDYSCTGMHMSQTLDLNGKFQPHRQTVAVHIQKFPRKVTGDAIMCGTSGAQQSNITTEALVGLSRL